MLQCNFTALVLFFQLTHKSSVNVNFYLYRQFLHLFFYIISSFFTIFIFVQTYEYLLFAGLIGVATVIFIILAYRYKYVDESEFTKEENEDHFDWKNCNNSILKSTRSCYGFPRHFYVFLILEFQFETQANSFLVLKYEKILIFFFQIVKTYSCTHCIIIALQRDCSFSSLYLWNKNVFAFPSLHLKCSGKLYKKDNSTRKKSVV